MEWLLVIIAFLAVFLVVYRIIETMEKISNMADAITKMERYMEKWMRYKGIE